jgi:hypothetical protein
MIRRGWSEELDRAELRALVPDQLTPLEALQLLAEMKRRLE